MDVLSQDFLETDEDLSAHCALRDPMLSAPAVPTTLPGLAPASASPEFADGAMEDSRVIDAIIGSVQPLARHAIQDSFEGVLPPPGVDSGPSPVTVNVPAARDEIARTVLDWTRAWSARNAQAYLAHYSADFSTGEPGFSLAQWSQQRRQRLLKPAWITVKAQDLRVEMTGSDSAQVRFQQEYRSPAVNETTRKMLVLRRQGDAWRILSERAD